MCAAATADPKGLKRICPNCGTRYFDLNKRPIQCPSCSTEFKAETKTKGRRGRLPANDPVKAAPVRPAVVEEEEVAVADGDETVSLEEVEEDEAEEADEDIDAIDPDLGIAGETDDEIDDEDDEEDDVIEDVEEE